MKEPYQASNEDAEKMIQLAEFFFEILVKQKGTGVINASEYITFIESFKLTAIKVAATYMQPTKVANYFDDVRSVLENSMDIYENIFFPEFDRIKKRIKEELSE